MYNKLFSKILDSSIWLESDSTRIVWLTLIATMNEDGFCQFASIGNLAQRAIVPLEKCKDAVKVLEAPDPESGDPSNEGRRIERVPGGWMVLNSKKYKDMVTAVVIREQTRIRVAEHRARKKGNAIVTNSNASLKNVTPSETETETETGEHFLEGKSADENQRHPPPGRFSAQDVAESRMIRAVEDGEPMRKANFAGPELHKALYDDMRKAAFRERIPLSIAKGIFKGHLTYGMLPWIDQLDSPQEIIFPSDSNQGSNELSSQDAGRSLAELMGLSGKVKLSAPEACEAVKKRFPEKRYDEIPAFVQALWKEYCEDVSHGRTAFHNWLATIGTYLDKQWKKKTNPASTSKAASPTPEWAYKK